MILKRAEKDVSNLILGMLQLKVKNLLFLVKRLEEVMLKGLSSSDSISRIKCY